MPSKAFDTLNIPSMTFGCVLYRRYPIQVTADRKHAISVHGGSVKAYLEDCSLLMTVRGSSYTYIHMSLTALYAKHLLVCYKCTTDMLYFKFTHLFRVLVDLDQLPQHANIVILIKLLYIGGGLYVGGGFGGQLDE